MGYTISVTLLLVLDKTYWFIFLSASDFDLFDETENSFQKRRHEFIFAGYWNFNFKSLPQASFIILLSRLFNIFANFTTFAIAILKDW